MEAAARELPAGRRSAAAAPVPPRTKEQIADPAARVLASCDPPPPTFPGALARLRALHTCTCG